MFIAQNMAPIMFASLIIFLLLGYPVAFSLAANGLLFFFIGVELAPYSGGAINLAWPLLYALPERFLGAVMSNDTLLAIPFFTFMGIVLERIAAWPRTCSIRSASCSGRSAAASPMP